jgi:hypothetical protein
MSGAAELSLFRRCDTDQVRYLPGISRKVQAIGFREGRLREAVRGRRDLRGNDLGPVHRGKTQEQR